MGECVVRVGMCGLGMFPCVIFTVVCYVLLHMLILTEYWLESSSAIDVSDEVWGDFVGC